LLVAGYQSEASAHKLDLEGLLSMLLAMEAIFGPNLAIDLWDASKPFVCSILSIHADVRGYAPKSIKSQKRLLACPTSEYAKKSAIVG